MKTEKRIHYICNSLSPFFNGGLRLTVSNLINQTPKYKGRTLAFHRTLDNRLILAEYQREVELTPCTFLPKYSRKDQIAVCETLNRAVFGITESRANEIVESLKLLNP